MGFPLPRSRRSSMTLPVTTNPPVVSSVIGERCQRLQPHLLSTADSPDTSWSAQSSQEPAPTGDLSAARSSAHRTTVEEPMEPASRQWGVSGHITSQET